MEMYLIYFFLMSLSLCLRKYMEHFSREFSCPIRHLKTVDYLINIFQISSIMMVMSISVVLTWWFVAFGRVEHAFDVLKSTENLIDKGGG